MLKKLFASAVMAGILGLCAQDVLAQDLGAFPVDRRREAPEKDGLIRNARLSSTGFGFLKLTTNARSVGMGDAFSAVGNDISSIFSNPAGLTQMETERAAMGGYTKWIVGSTLGTAAFAVKTSVATFGVSAVFFTSETFEETTSQNPGGPLNSTKPLVLMIYQTAFNSFDMGYAAAQTVVLFLVLLVVSLLQLRLLRDR